jgi:hypothetical protein
VFTVFSGSRLSFAKAEAAKLDRSFYCKSGGLLRVAVIGDTTRNLYLFRFDAAGGG